MTKEASRADALRDEELDALVNRAEKLLSSAKHMNEADGVEVVSPGIVPDLVTTITTLRECEARLRAQLAEAHTRIEAMESGDWSELKLVRFENGQMDITAGPIPAIAEYLAQMMQDGEGKYFNFMEVSINHNTAGPMTLSLQRKNGKTPNQLRKEAEARADRAEAALADAREKALREAAEILDEEGWLGMSKHRILALITEGDCVIEKPQSGGFAVQKE